MMQYKNVRKNMSNIKLYLKNEQPKTFDTQKQFDDFLHHNKTIETIGTRLEKVTLDDGKKEVALVIPEYQKNNKETQPHLEKFHITNDGYNHQEIVSPFLRMNIVFALNKLSKEHEEDLKHKPAKIQPK